VKLGADGVDGTVEDADDGDHEAAGNIWKHGNRFLSWERAAQRCVAGTAIAGP
jgi:hypothetical protein